MALAKKIILLFIFSFTASFAWAAYNNTLLVLDMRNAPDLPAHFRSTSDPILNSKTINTSGFADLHIAGGAQFSKFSLEKILQKLKQNNITVVDLRQESHGFVNGNAISWYGPHDAANAGLSDVGIEHNQARLLSELDKHNIVTVNKILKKTLDERIEAVKPIDYSVHSIASERDVVESRRLNYFRLYIQDFHAPQPKQVERFVEFVKAMPKDNWIYFHCRAGVGRTSTFMALFDMMRNAKHVPLDDILERQTALGGKDLKELPPADSYKYKLAEQRLKFLEAFYAYAHDNDDNFETSWRQWLKTHKKK